MAKTNMKAVRMEGKVIGYVGKAADGWWKATDAKRRVLADFWSREQAVNTVVYNGYGVRRWLEEKTTEAIARMDKKRIRV